MKLLVKALSLALITLPLLATAGTKSASMQVSFTVTDACTVQTGVNQAKTPTVACQLNAPHLLTPTTPAPAAAPAKTTTTATTATTATTDTAATATGTRQDWTIYF